MPKCCCCQLFSIDFTCIVVASVALILAVTSCGAAVAIRGSQPNNPLILAATSCGVTVATCDSQPNSLLMYSLPPIGRVTFFRPLFLINYHSCFLIHCYIFISLSPSPFYYAPHLFYFSVISMFKCRTTSKNGRKRERVKIVECTVQRLRKVRFERRANASTEVEKR
jgi:hypothetical protein